MQQPESTMTVLVAATGLRFSELAGLQWQDVDYNEQCIHVRRTEDLNIRVSVFPKREEILIGVSVIPVPYRRTPLVFSFYTALGHGLVGLIHVVIVPARFASVDAETGRPERPLWDGVEVIPSPSVALLRFEHFRLTTFPISDEADMRIMLRSIPLEVSNELKAHFLDFDSTFLERLPSGTTFKRLHVVKMPAWESKLARAMRTLPPAEQDLSVL